jgi:hypothetical protein
MVQAAAAAQVLLEMMEPAQMAVMAAQELPLPFLVRLLPTQAEAAVRNVEARLGRAALVVAEMALTMTQPAALEVQILAVEAEAADFHQRAALAALVAPASSLSATPAPMPMRLQQPARPRSPTRAATRFTSSPAVGV